MSDILDYYRSARPDLASVSDQDLIKMLHDASGIGGSQRAYARDYLGVKNTGGIVRDTGIDLAKGMVGLGQAATGIADLATGGLAGRGIRNTFGGDLSDASNKLDQYYSDARQDANDAVSQAQGFWGTAKALVQNPRALIGDAVQSAPAMLIPGGVAGRVSEGVLAKGLEAAEAMAPMARAAATRSAVKAAEVAGNRASSATWVGISAGQTADKINHEMPDDPTAMYAGALGAGAAVGAVTHGFSFLPGGHMADQAATTGARLGLSVANQAGMMSTMGAGQTVAENAATGKPLDQGLAQAMGSGLVSGAAFGLFGAKKRGENPAIGAADDAAARAAVADTDFQTQWNAWAQQIQQRQDARNGAVQPTVDAATGVSRPAVPNNAESMEAALNEPTSQWGQNPENGFERNLTVGDLNAANQEPQAPQAATAPSAQVDPAAAQLAATQAAASPAKPTVAPVSDAERQAVFNKFGTAYPNVIEGKFNEQGNPLTVGQHFDGSTNPYLSPDKLNKAVDKLALAERNKPEGQRAAEQVLSDSFKQEMGRYPTSKEVAKLGKEVALDSVHDKTTLMAHIDARLAIEKAKTKPDPFMVDTLTIWRKGVDPNAEPLVKAPAEPTKVTVDDKGQVAETKPQDDAQAPATQTAANPLVDLLQTLVNKQSKGSDTFSYTDHNGKDRTIDRSTFLNRIAGLEGKQRDRFNMLMGLDGEGHQVSNPMTHAEIAEAESAKYGHEVTPSAISNWAKDMGLSQHVIDKASAVHLETSGHDEYINPESGLHVVENAGDINKGGLGTQDLTAAQKHQQKQADEFMRKAGREGKAAPQKEAPESAQVIKNRALAAEQNRLLGMQLAEKSTYRQAALDTYRLLRRKGEPRMEELTPKQQAAWVLTYEEQQRAGLHGHDVNIEREYRNFLKDVQNDHAERTEPAVHTAGHADPESSTASDLRAPETGPASSAALREDPVGGGDAVGQVLRQPEVVVKKKRVPVREQGEPRVQAASEGHLSDEQLRGEWLWHLQEEGNLESRVSKKAAELEEYRQKVETYRQKKGENEFYHGLVDQLGDFERDHADAKDKLAAVSARLRELEAARNERATKTQEASGRNPDVVHGRLTPIEAENFSTATDAARWVRDNTTNPMMRMVAEKIMPFLGDVEFNVHQPGEKIDSRLVSRFARGAMGLTVVHRDGKVSVHMVSKDVNPNSMTHETLLHELVHAATMKRMENQAIRTEVAKLADQVAAVMRVSGDEFFHRQEIFGSPDEFMAYGLTSPTFQSWMKQMDASGNLRRADGPRLQHMPEPTLWQKFVDVVRKMFGLAPAFKANIERAMEANREATQQYENNTLESRMQQLLDKTLATPEHARYENAPAKIAAASEGVVDSPAATRSAIEDNIKRLPPVLRKPVRGVMATIHDGAIKGAQASAFMHDLADWADKHNMPSMKKVADVMAKRGAFKLQRDQDLGKVVKSYQDLPVAEQDKVQAFMKDSTFEQRWGYQPAWRDKVEVNPTAKAQYDALSPEAQKVADEVFKHNADMLKAKQKALADIIQAHYTELASRAEDKDVAALWKQMDTEVKAVFKDPMEGPYAPLKRFGNQVVTVKSKALLDAKENNPNKYREMLDDPQHYRVEMHDGVYRAENRRAQLEDELGDTHVVERSEKENHMPLGAGYETLSRLSDAMKARFDGEGYSEADKKVAHATYRAIQEAIIQSLGEHNARTSTLQRKYIAGVDSGEMMRGFATQGYADNAFLTNMLHSRELNDHISSLRTEKDAGGDRTIKQQFFNELQARRAASLTADTPRWVGQAMRFTTLWKLVTSPAYYLQYLSQPITMFLPLVQGDHGYKAGLGALVKGIGDTAKIAKGLFDTDLSQVKDAGERKMLQDLRAEGAIQIGHEQQFGRLQTMPERGFSKAWQSATDKVTMLPHSVEMHNRIASALAAYRLEMAKHGDAQRATDYAKKAIYGAYGDYSSYNAPRIMQGGAISKLVMQYRQFQLIHTALLVRLMGNAFKGETPDVRRAAKLQLGYMAGHYGALAGALGIPAAHVVAGALKGVFGDDNDKDIETFVNRHTGNKFLADMILGGVPRAAFGQDLSSRMGAGDILSPFRYVNMSDALTSRKGYQDTTIAALGPFIGGLLPQMVGGINQVAHGDYYCGMEQLMPKGVADVMKAVRFADEGVIDRKGQTIVPQVSTGDVIAQGLGSRPTSVYEPQHNAAVVAQIQQGFKDEANSIKSQFVRARKNGDDVSELVDKWRDLMDKQRKAGMKPDPLSTLYKAPVQMMQRDRMMIDGVPYRKTTRGLVQDVVGNQE